MSRRVRPPPCDSAVGEGLDGSFAEERTVVAGETALVKKTPIVSGAFHGSGAGRRVQQRPAGAVQTLVVQIGDRVQAEQVLEEILHAAMAEPEGSAEVVEVNGFVGVRSEKITRFSQPTVACGEAGCGWRNEIVASAAQGSEEGFEQFALEIMTDQGVHRCIAGLPDHRLAPVEEGAQAGLLARADSHGGTASEDRLGNVGKRRGQGDMKMRGGNGQCDVAIAGRSHGIQDPAGREETHVAVRMFDAEVEGATDRWAGADKDQRETVCRHGSAKEHRRTEGGEIEASSRADDAGEPAECGSRTELAGFELRPPNGLREHFRVAHFHPGDGWQWISHTPDGGRCDGPLTSSSTALFGYEFPSSSTARVVRVAVIGSTGDSSSDCQKL